MCLPLAANGLYGLRKLHGAALWQNTRIVNEGERPMRVFVEYGRRYTPASAGLKPIVPFYLATRGHLHPADPPITSTYEVPSGVGPTLCWNEWTMPASGRSIAAWMHSHAGVDTDLWALLGAASGLLPPAFSSPALAGTGPVPLAGVPHLEFRRNLSASLASSGALLCTFHTRTVTIGGERYTRGSQRTGGEGCDSWRFRMGDKITLVGLLKGQHDGLPYPMHLTMVVYAHLDDF